MSTPIPTPVERLRLSASLRCCIAATVNRQRERFQTWVRERATNGLLDDAQKTEIPSCIENNAAAVAAEPAATA